MKKNKSSAVMEMLKKGLTVKQIRNRMAVSESYVYLAKKKLADMAEGALITADEAITEAAAALKEACTFTPKPEPEVRGVDKVLDERGDNYGVFMQNADTAIKIKGAMHNAIARNDLHLFPDQLLALDMIAVKISRIVNGNPVHRDSWIDIAGYATLVADRLQGKSR
jgi:hypothetical protein